jgi:hypothetical protein
VGNLFKVATIATPQASCSLAGLYNPSAIGVVEKSELLFN